MVSSFQGVEEYKKMVASVSKEKDIKSRIKELLRYRKNGISTLSEAESYESQRLKRNKRKAERKKALESGILNSVTDTNAGAGYDQSPIKEEVKKADLDKLSSIVGLPGRFHMEGIKIAKLTNLKVLAHSLDLIFPFAFHILVAFS